MTRFSRSISPAIRTIRGFHSRHNALQLHEIKSRYCIRRYSIPGGPSEEGGKGLNRSSTQAYEQRPGISNSNSAGPSSSSSSSSSSSARSSGSSSLVWITGTVLLIVGGTQFLLQPPSTSTTTASFSSSSLAHSSLLSSLFGGARSNRSTSTLDPYTHNPLPLVSSEYYPDPRHVSAHKLLQIATPSSVSSPSKSPTSSSTLQDRLVINSIYIKEPSLVIERAYTPLYDVFSSSLQHQECIQLLVKSYPDGEVGRFLHRLPAQSNVEVRGPVKTWSYERDYAPFHTNHSNNKDSTVPEHIVMLVGGTGITPAYQLLTNVLGRPRSSTLANSSSDSEQSRINISKNTRHASASASPKFTLLYAAQDLQNTLLVKELAELSRLYPTNLSVHLFVERLPHDQELAGSQVQGASSHPSELVLTKHGSSSGWNPLSWFSSTSGSVNPKMALSDPAGTKDVKIPVYESRITRSHLQALIPAPSSPNVAVNSTQSASEAKAESTPLILVCGPDGMVHHLAGPKSRDGKTQGELKGLLASLGYAKEDVFKL